MTIAEWTKLIHQMAVEKGWWETDRNVGEQIALMHSELSEALEEWREGRMETWYTEKGKPEGFGIELIDCVIRIFDTLGKYGFDAEELLEIKTTYNATRPYRHGGKLA